jgi:hypothetical protein
MFLCSYSSMDFYPFNVAHEDPGPTQWHRRNQVNFSMFITSSTPCSLRRQHQTRKTYRTYIPVVFFWFLHLSCFTSGVFFTMSSPHLLMRNFLMKDRTLHGLDAVIQGAAGTSLANVMRGAN